MWTPKRILLLAGGFVLFVSAYLVYANFLGGIDGLPPLPEAYWPGQVAGPLVEPPYPLQNNAEKLLRQAFHDDERVLKCPFKLEVNARGLVLAFGHYQIRDGGVELAPFYVAIFGKDKGDGKPPEVNTVKSKTAFITFDRPINNIYEMNNRKIVEGTLRDDVEIVNNRRTPQQDDDLSLFTQGPLVYREERHQIWTDDVVRIIDPQTRPEPTCVTATGMDVYLTVEKPSPVPTKGAPPPRKNKTETVSGVDKIALRANVSMDLWIDGKSGFLAAPAKPEEKKPAKDARAAAAPPKPAEPAKAKVTIKTQGPFTYDLHTDHATFDISHHPGPVPNHVAVNRTNEVEHKHEQLICEHLELQFRRRAPAAGTGDKAAPRDERGMDLEIEAVDATGADVTLTSDAENMEASGNELHYEARTRTMVLKGAQEMVAMKEGNIIHARELRMRNEPGGSQAAAKGPGRIEMLDAKTGQRPLTATWKDELIYGRDGTFDLLVLTGDAAFEDKEHGQQLGGDLVKVWLNRAENRGAAETHRPLPHHVEASGRVRADSSDMRIRDAERLTVWFRDLPPEPAAATPPAPAATAAPSTPATPAKPQEPAKPKRPLNLTARLVEAHVLRGGAKNDLEKLWCEGKVHVTQAPATPDDKGMDIKGDTLQMTRHPEGNEVAVAGGENPAQVQVDKTFILGPSVHLDQAQNKAWVNGIGALRMPSNNRFDGSKLEKPADLVIHWQKSMHFHGKQAEFQGNVQAEQENARLLCQTMQVSLDRPVSFREDEKGGPQPKLDRLVCSVGVRVEEKVVEQGKLRLYRRIDCPELSFDNEAGRVIATGPGVVRMLQPGSAGLAPPQPAGGHNAPKKPADDEELKLTRVTYDGRMSGNNVARTARFFDKVEVVHVPTDNPDMTIDLTRPPTDLLYLTCRQLDVRSNQESSASPMKGAKTTQELIGSGSVYIEQQQQFRGWADEVKYDEAQERVIFEANQGNTATLQRVLVVGGKPDTNVGRKITYWRKTNDFKVDDGLNFNLGK